MTGHSTHPSLLHRLGDSNDQAAWREFDHRYGPLIGGYCRSRGLQPADADDVRQTVMLSLARNMTRFEYDRSRGRFRDYLRRVVRNAITAFATARGRSATPLGPSFFEACTSQEDGVADELWEQAWVRHHYRMALDTLRQRCHAQTLAIFDRLVAGDPVHRVADTFGVNYDAVLRVRQRVRDRLREIIAAQLQDEEPWEHTRAPQ